ncbi:carbohydrate esterase family 16 protein [Plenodomus tracheiphilus IPT5]|uniref:Carbohydrate esterase family 16 protein n=1 Tax=Plenodomus tracheiphilus IPT5 TaxID=1408161 RepID=A0A6A7B863_9PLEO|nr:carbohydrate esterase family 16 protein [Plenodomus tracheiphilus IPT5]
MMSPWILKFLVANLAFAVGDAGRASHAWKEGKFKTLVTFGDSYTDENRLGYFINNKGSAPPVAWEQPVGLSTASGGRSWARYASVYSNATLYNYAVSGAVCSNQVTPRDLAAINAPFPDIAGYEVPAFIADSKALTSNGTKFFTGKPASTVYAIWIGTNDLGNNAFLTDSQVPGKTVGDYIDCVYDQVARLYANGARNFILLNLAPLDLLPQYASPEMNGLAATQFFPNKPLFNASEIHGRMQQTVSALNQVYAYRTPFTALVSDHYRDAKFANFNVNQLMTDIYYHPAQYLNGTAPLVVEGVNRLCDPAGQNCTSSSSPDSYVWYDPLHPSEQTSRVVAREFVKVMGGVSEYAEYWG